MLLCVLVISLTFAHELLTVGFSQQFTDLSKVVYLKGYCFVADFGVQVCRFVYVAQQGEEFHVFLLGMRASSIWSVLNVT